MKCECGEELRFLFYPKNIISPMEMDTDYIETDYAICSKCEKVYRRIIQTKVIWKLMIITS